MDNEKLTLYLSKKQVSILMIISGIFFVGFSVAFYIGKFADYHTILNILFMGGYIFTFMTFTSSIAHIYKISYPVIEYDDNGFVVYNKITKKPEYFIPASLIWNIQYDKNKRQIYIFLTPGYKTGEYAALIRDEKKPEKLQSYKLKVPMIIPINRSKVVDSYDSLCNYFGIANTQHMFGTHAIVVSVFLVDI